MKSTFSRITIAGKIQTDLLFRTTNGGSEMVQFSLIILEAWKKRTGETGERVEWHRISVYGEDNVAWVRNNLKKGDLVLIEGHLSYSDWEDRFGVKHHHAQIIISGRDGRILPLTRLEQMPFFDEEAWEVANQNKNDPSPLSH